MQNNIETEQQSDTLIHLHQSKGFWNEENNEKY